MMITKAIRGAITVENNSVASIREATLELMNKIVADNNIDKSQVSHVIFTLTNDLDADFPAKFVRIDMGWNNVAMMCYNELNVPDSLPKCLRVMVVINCAENFVPVFVYLKDAQKLRN